MILGKYQTKRRLGKGAYGQVVLAEDKNKNKYAIKMISLKTFRTPNQYLLEYLQSQINCLKLIKSPYVMKLLSTEQDNDFKYMICEYCEGGDILNVQAKQPNKVFTLQKATQILSFVIKGLQCLHSDGYVHRDIKAENILMKTENGKQVYKLSDFGFTKNIKDISYTILGTGAYMSPEIYKEQQYGFAVDMWAFGVLFFFMLNMEFPFRISPMSQKKHQELQLAANNFSYKKVVSTTRKKIYANCTPAIEDLFKKMLHPNPNYRISFHEIRQHEIFKRHFQNQQNQLSKSLYTLKNKIIRNEKLVESAIDNDCGQKTHSQILRKDSQFEQQIGYIKIQTSKINFLKDCLKQIQKHSELPQIQMLSFGYNLSKFKISVIEKLIRDLQNNNFEKRKQNLNWKKFLKTQKFQSFIKEVKDNLQKSKFQIKIISNECQKNMIEILKLNPEFQQSYQRKLDCLSEQFKSSFRRSTKTCYQFLLKKLKQSRKKGNLINYHMTLIAICHAYNKIFQNQNQLLVIFGDYFRNYNRNQQNYDFEEVNQFLAACTATQLNAIIVSIIQAYF